MAQPDPSDELRLVSHACSCTARLLKHQGVGVTKATRLDTPDEFDRAVARLAMALREQAHQSEQEALRRALDELDVDWLATNAAQRRHLLDLAQAAAAQAFAPIPSRLLGTLSGAAQDVAGAARRHAGEAGLSIGSDFTALDHRMMRFMTRSQTLFVRDEYGRRAEALGEQARSVVARGLAYGYGRDDIAEALAEAAEAALVKRSASYWDVAAGAFVGRGRSYAQVGSFQEAGIGHYRIVAVLDERTSNICRLLHGKFFAVGDAISNFEAAERLENPEAVKSHNPWPREDAAGLYIVRGNRRIDLGNIERSGMGAWDDLGKIISSHSNVELAQLGLGYPPYHGLCRTSVTMIA